MTTHTLADGATVTMTAESFDLSDPWNSTFEIRFGPNGATRGELIDEFDVYRLGNHEGVVERVIGGSVVESLAFQGGSLVVAHGVEQGFIAWLGKQFEIAVYTQSPQPSLQEAIRRFESLSITEVADGLMVSSLDPSCVVRSSVARKLVPGLGVVFVKSPEDAVKLMPDWKGKPVKAGEVWRIDTPDSEPDQVLLGTPTCAAVLSPGYGSTPRDLIAFASAVRSLRWNRK